MSQQELLRRVASVIATIADPPNSRKIAVPGDAPGPYHLWFDGGAVRYVTGTTEFIFDDGTLATIAVLPYVSISVTLPDGRKVTVREPEGRAY